MEAFNIERSRNLLQQFHFADLFIDELGWNQASGKQSLTVIADGVSYTCQPLAELSGMMVFTVLADNGQIPYSKLRAAVQREVAKSYHENLLIFVDDNGAHSVWYWVKREGGKSYPRTHHYDKWQDPEFHLGKISGLFVAMSELDPEGRMEITRVVQRVQGALDIERVTKRFYGEFQQVHDLFMVYLEPSIADEKDRRWYTSALLNRLMFIYFLQRQRLIDNGATNYLHDKLKGKDWQDRYYLDFLHPLFFEGFARPQSKRSAQAQAVLGVVPYLNGGLFLHHAMEIKYTGQITIPDQAFAELFALLDGYTWHLDDRPGKDNKEINPDVLGYIFEKYINQKAFGAYYTRPEITEYLCEQTIERLVLEKMREVDEHDLGILPPLHYEDVHELLRKMDGRRALILLQEILPKLSLLDPACGSGAFLVAALQTLTAIYQSALGRAHYLDDTALRQYLDKELATHPNQNYYIRKKIISHNLFGVDIMDEAVEIARLRLFLALVATIRQPQDLEPLPNIDFNILPGNSLIGLLRVDEAAYQQYYQPDLFSGPVITYRHMVETKERLVKSYRLANTLTDDVEALRKDIETHRQKAQATLNQILLNEFGELGITYEQATWDSHQNKEGQVKKRALTLADMTALQPFHWGYEFDEVMNTRGGFDAIITNPPWEVFQTYEKEFFQEYAPSIQKKKLRIEDWGKQKKELLEDEDVRKDWLAYLSRFPHQLSYFKKSSQYTNQISIVNGKAIGNKLNLYGLFTEQCSNLLRKGGVCGTVIPSGIYTDLGTKGLREMLFEQTEVMGIFGFENRRTIFEGVDSRFKFVVLTFCKGKQTENFPATFMRHDVAELEQFPGQNSVNVSVELVYKLSPDSLSITEFGNSVDVEIATSVSRFPMLANDEPGWNLEIYGEELNMTRDSGYFKTEPTSSPLYEGSMIWHFEHRYADARYWIEESELRQSFLQKKVKRISGLDTRPADLKNDYETYRLGIRKIARNTDTRTLITTILPRNVLAGNSIAINFPFFHEPDRYNKLRIEYDELICLVALLNSLVSDYVLRSRMTANLNTFYLYQLPVPRLTNQVPAFQPIVSRAAQLICTTPEFDDLAAAVGLGSHTNGVTDPIQRAQLRAELDGLVAHVYGLSEEEFTHILSTFPLVTDDVKEAALHEYRQLAPNPQLLALISSGENASVEFKQAACRNPYTGKQDNSMRDNITKAVAAFMNGSGGTLLIGIADDGTIVGIEAEYALANPAKANGDGYDLFLADLLNKSLIVATAFQYFTITRHTLHGHDIAQIEVQPAPEPAYVHNKLYVRAGAQSKELQGPDLVGYVNGRFPSLGA